jgi:hypothetical protein
MMKTNRYLIILEEAHEDRKVHLDRQAREVHEVHPAHQGLQARREILDASAHLDHLDHLDHQALQDRPEILDRHPATIGADHVRMTARALTSRKIYVQRIFRPSTVRPKHSTSG